MLFTLVFKTPYVLDELTPEFFGDPIENTPEQMKQKNLLENSSDSGKS